jgi:hypothetical protein
MFYAKLPSYPCEGNLKNCLILTPHEPREDKIKFYAKLPPYSSEGNLKNCLILLPWTEGG